VVVLSYNLSDTMCYPLGHKLPLQCDEPACTQANSNTSTFTYDLRGKLSQERNFIFMKDSSSSVKMMNLFTLIPIQHKKM